MSDKFKPWLEEQYKQARDKLIDETADAIFSPQRKSKTTLAQISRLMHRQEMLQEILNKYQELEAEVEPFVTLADGSEWLIGSAITSRRLMLETKGEAVDVVAFGYRVSEDDEVQP